MKKVKIMLMTEITVFVDENILISLVDCIENLIKENPNDDLYFMEINNNMIYDEWEFDLYTLEKVYESNKKRFKWLEKVINKAKRKEVNYIKVVGN